MLKIRRRVLVYASDSDRVPFFLHRERAITLLAAGRITIEAKDKSKSVIAVRLTADTSGALESARPGSFGIDRERIAPAPGGKTAGLVFSHRPTHERTLSGMAA